MDGKLTLSPALGYSSDPRIETDPRTGAFVDYDEQVADQNNGTKVKIPTHVMYSVYNLGSEFDVPSIWANYTDPSANLTVEGVGDGIGHFIIEEAPGGCLIFVRMDVECADGVCRSSHQAAQRVHGWIGGCELNGATRGCRLRYTSDLIRWTVCNGVSLRPMPYIYYKNEIVVLGRLA